MCQACVDNGDLTQYTFDRIEAFVDSYPDAAFGPAHIVMDDFNVTDSHIQFAITETQRALDEHDPYCDPDTLGGTLAFLKELLLTPEIER